MAFCSGVAAMQPDLVCAPPLRPADDGKCLLCSAEHCFFVSATPGEPRGLLDADALFYSVLSVAIAACGVVLVSDNT